MIEGLITGIGFIGGGAILKQGNSVHGIATARVRGPFLTLKLLTLVKDDSETNDIRPD